MDFPEKSNINQTESFSSFPKKKLPRLPEISWQSFGEVHAGNLLQLSFTRSGDRLLLTFRVTFSQGWGRQLYRQEIFLVGRGVFTAEIETKKQRRKCYTLVQRAERFLFSPSVKDQHSQGLPCSSITLLVGNRVFH